MVKLGVKKVKRLIIWNGGSPTVLLIYLLFVRPEHDYITRQPAKSWLISERIL
jgi:hypothetical protein